MNGILVPLSEAKVRFHELIRELSEREVLLLHHGRPVGVMIGFDVYQGLLERLEELEDRLPVFEVREEGEDARTAWAKVKVPPSTPASTGTRRAGWPRPPSASRSTGGPARRTPPRYPP